MELYGAAWPVLQRLDAERAHDWLTRLLPEVVRWDKRQRTREPEAPGTVQRWVRALEDAATRCGTCQ